MVRPPQNRGRMQRASITIIFALAVCFMTGCFWVTTKSEGETLRADVGLLQKRADKAEQGIGGKVSKLEEVLKRATSLLQRNSADLGDEVHSMESELRELRGLVSQATRQASEIKVSAQSYEARFAAFEKRLAALEKTSANPPPPKDTAGDVYLRGKAAFDSGKYKVARTEFRKLEVKYPKHMMVDEALYYRAESYFRQKDYGSAIGVFQKIFRKYRDRNMADDAFYRAAEAAQRLKNCREARAYLDALIKKYKKSPLVRRAKTLDKRLVASLRNRTKCR